MTAEYMNSVYCTCFTYMYMYHVPALLMGLPPCPRKVCIPAMHIISILNVSIQRTPPQSSVTLDPWSVLPVVLKCWSTYQVPLVCLVLSTGTGHNFYGVLSLYP